jgi:hypothetical protein
VELSGYFPDSFSRQLGELAVLEGPAQYRVILSSLPLRDVLRALK